MAKRTKCIKSTYQRWVPVHSMYLGIYNTSPLVWENSPFGPRARPVLCRHGKVRPVDISHGLFFICVYLCFNVSVYSSSTVLHKQAWKYLKGQVRNGTEKKKEEKLHGSLKNMRRWGETFACNIESILCFYWDQCIWGRVRHAVCSWVST